MSEQSNTSNLTSAKHERRIRVLVIGALGLATVWSVAARAMNTLYDLVYIGSVVLAMDVVIPPDRRKVVIDAVRTNCAPLMAPAFAWGSHVFMQGKKAIEDELAADK